MKISKLFHWLYGLVMLLPIFAIGVTCGYAMFNKNAYQSFTGKQKIENIQYLSDSSPTELPTGEDITYYFTSNINSHDTSNSGWFEWEDISLTNLPTNAYRFRIKFDARNIQIQTTNNTYSNIQFEDFTFTLKEFTNSDTGLTYLSNIYFITYSNSGTLDNVFYYSIDKVTQSNLFNWAYDSFLVAPFTYIVSLFSMPANSPVVMLLSYWLAISIIWLVFDLVMYVPLLVHRWLDKGGIE